jgi:molybdenum cofactor cytidylyltransferase
LNLAQALAPELPARIAIVGAGGKSTAMFQLAGQLPGKVWTTTTTHLGIDQLDRTDQHYIISEPREIDLPRLISKHSTLITGLFTANDRVRGPELEVLEALVRCANDEGISLIVEADGSRLHPLKAPAEHEPVIPAWVKMVVVVVGMSALDKPLSPVWVHRPERFEALTGLRQGELITVDAVCRMLLHPQGGLKGIPPRASRAVLFNQVENGLTLDRVMEGVRDLYDGGYSNVIIGSLQHAPDELHLYP